MSGNLRGYNLAANTLAYTMAFDPFERPLTEVDIALTPNVDTAIVPTVDEEGSGTVNLRFVSPDTGAPLAPKLDLDPFERLVKGVDLVVSTDSATAVLATEDSSGSGHLRTIDVTSGGVTHKVDFDVNEHPYADVDPLLYPDPVDGAAVALLPTYDEDGPHGQVWFIRLADGSLLRKLNFATLETPVEGVDALAVTTTTAIMPTAYRPGDSGKLHFFNLTTRFFGPTISFDVDEHPVADVDAVATPDGKRVLLPTFDNVGPSGQLWIMDVTSKTVEHKIDFDPNEHPIRDVDVVLTPGGEKALMPTFDEVGASGQLRIINVASGIVEHKVDFAPMEHPINGVDVVVTPDGTKALMPTFDNEDNSGQLRIVNVATGAVLNKIDFAPMEHPINGVDVVVTPDGTKALMPTYKNNDASGALRIIDIASGTVLAKIDFDPFEHPVEDVDVTLSPDATKAIMPTEDAAPGPGGQVRIIDIASGAVLAKIDFDPGERPEIAVDAITMAGAAQSYDFFDEDFQKMGEGNATWDNGDVPPGRERKKTTDKSVVWVDARTASVVAAVNLGGQVVGGPQPTPNGREKFVVRTPGGGTDIVIVDDITRQVAARVALPGAPVFMPGSPGFRGQTANGREKYIVRTPGGDRVVLFDDILGAVVANVPLGGMVNPVPPMLLPDGQTEKIFVWGPGGLQVVFFNDVLGAIVNQWPLGLANVKWAEELPNGNEKYIGQDNAGNWVVVVVNPAGGIVGGGPLPGKPIMPPKRDRYNRDFEKIITPPGPPNNPPNNPTGRVFWFSDVAMAFDPPLGVPLAGAPLGKPRDNSAFPAREKQPVRIGPPGGPPNDAIQILNDAFHTVGPPIVPDPVNPVEFIPDYAGNYIFPTGRPFYEKVVYRRPAPGGGWLYFIAYFNDRTMTFGPPIPLGGDPFVVWWTLFQIDFGLYMPHKLAMIDDVRQEMVAQVTLPDNPVGTPHDETLSDIISVSLANGDLALLDIVQKQLKTVSMGDGTHYFAQPSDEGSTTVFDAGAIRVTCSATEAVTGMVFNTLPNDSEHPPAGFIPKSPVYDVIVLGQLNSGAVVNILYNSSLTPEQAGKLRMYHWENGGWRDVTTGVDTISGVVRGRVASFSPIVLGDPVVPTGFNIWFVGIFGLALILLGISATTKIGKRLTRSIVVRIATAIH